MHPLLVCLSVFFLSECLECFTRDVIHDLSDECVKGRNITTYLTCGMGKNDIFVGMVAKEDVNCTMTFLVGRSKYIIVVVEFLDWFPGKDVCGNENNEVNVMVSKENVTNICHKVNKGIYRNLGQESVSVSIKSEKELPTIKITATSATVLLDGKCQDLEVVCMYDDELYCLTEASKCDNNPNCGVLHKYDENPSYCKNYQAVKLEMVFVGLITVFLTFCLMVALLKKIVPNREGTFIVKEDETLSEKDRATSETYYDVRVRIVYDQPEMNPTELVGIEEFNREEVFHRRMSARKKKGKRS